MWTQDLLDALGPVDAAHVDIRRAHAILDRNFPLRLFRYRRAEPREFEILERECVWLTAPNQFNDPYDSSFSISQARLMREHFRIAAVSGKMSPNLRTVFASNAQIQIEDSPDPLRTMIEIACAVDPQLANTTPTELARVFDDISEDVMSVGTQGLRDAVIENLRIACFSQRLDSLPMWAHYSNCHTGFCIEYDFAQLGPGDPRRRCLLPVIYSQVLFDWTPYLVMGLTDRKKFNSFVAELAAIHKAADWSYEQEWRLIIPFRDVAPEYRLPTPRALHAGLHIRNAELDQLRDVASSLCVPMRRMKLGLGGMESDLLST